MRVFLFVPALVIATLGFGLAAIVADSLDRRRAWALKIVPLWSRLLLAVGGVRILMAGDVPLHRRRGVVFVANHQSYLDILVLSSLLPHRLLWLARRVLFAIPVSYQAVAVVVHRVAERVRTDIAAEVDA